jgi:molybdenum cofactor cytidylyltransferase
MIAAIILAAGESSRMGSPKALLTYPLAGGGETSFAEHLVDVFDRSGAEPILIVLGHEADRIRGALDWQRACPIDNPRYREGMLSSIRAGVAALEDPEVEGALVCPVDHPGASPDVARALIRSFERRRSPIVLPVAAGRRGHPVLFSRSVFGELLSAPDGVGARQVVWDHESDLLEVAVSQPGVRVDLDTPAEYERWLREQRGR